MAYLVLSGIGALICVSLRKIARYENFSRELDLNQQIAGQNLQLKSLATMISSVTKAESAIHSEKPLDWKRFWELFSAKRELTDDERAEMARLKLGLQQMHARLMNEEKRKAEEFRRAIQIRLSEVRISDNRSDYLVHREDYKRGSDKERDYLRQHRAALFRTYDNRCAKCSDDSNGLEIDHFFFSKNEGGCFEMLHRDGFKVNNALPLCETCNRSKGDRSYRHFFSQYELLRVLEFNAKMNERLNQNKTYRWITAPVTAGA
jgi:5-methylcytosine-specific restriction endonuclease McrA